MVRTSTIKAPLFSEQVSFLAGLDESARAELRHYLDVAQDDSRPPSGARLTRAASLAAAVALIGMALVAFVPDARMPGLILAPLGLGSFAWLGRMALASHEKAAALLIQKLAHAVAKRQRSKSEEDKNG